MVFFAAPTWTAMSVTDLLPFPISPTKRARLPDPIIALVEQCNKCGGKMVDLRVHLGTGGHQNRAGEVIQAVSNLSHV